MERRERRNAVTVLAPAKLNLALDVVGLLPNGYHALDMTMQTITLYERVVLRRSAGLSLQLPGSPVQPNDKNTAIKAALAFFHYTGLLAGVDIIIHKNTPVRAGMAGGSADAAAVLRALRELIAPTLTDERLEAIGAGVGSDVPFCIRGGTQLAEGRGEMLTVLKAAPPLYAAICKPDFPISTPALFARVDGVTLTDRPDTAAMLAAIEDGNADALCANVRNVFEQALEGSQRNCVEKLKRALILYGARCAAMTGSGSAVFGLFRDEDACRAACEALQSESVAAFCAEFV